MLSSPEKRSGTSGQIATWMVPDLYRFHSQLDIPVEHISFQPPTGILPKFESPKERLLWPFRCWHRMSSDMRVRLVRNLQLLQARTHFAGVGGMEVVLFLIVWAINKLTNLGIEHVPCTNATESSWSRQEVLKRLDYKCRPCCIHGDIQERLPEDLKQVIEELLPSDKSSRESKALAYRKIEHEFESMYCSQPERCMKAPCIMHPEKVGGCWVSPTFEPVSKLRTEIKVILSGKEVVIIDSSDDENEGDVKSKEGPWLLDASGVVCKDCSAFGSHQGEAGRAMVGQCIWKQEERLVRPTLSITECTVDYEPKVAAQAMHDHRTYHCILKADDPGDVYNRNRSMTVSVDEEKAVLVEPLGNLYNVAAAGADFSFGTYWRASQEFKDNDMEFMKGQQVHPVGDVGWYDLLLPKQEEFKAEYEEISFELKSQARLNDIAEVAVDLDHNPRKRCRLSAIDGEELRSLQCMVGHGTTWHVGKSYPTLCSECCFLHGYATEKEDFDLVPDFPVRFDSLILQKLLPPLTVKAMMGNGWHLPSIGPFVMFTLSSLMPREVSRFDWPGLVRYCESFESGSDDGSASDLVQDGHDDSLPLEAQMEEVLSLEV